MGVFSKIKDPFPDHQKFLHNKIALAHAAVPSASFVELELFLPKELRDGKLGPVRPNYRERVAHFSKPCQACSAW